jgi:hypothetical protein
MTPIMQAMARATCLSFYGTEWSDTSEFRQGICLDIALASLEAIQAEGYAVVETSKIKSLELLVQARTADLVGAEARIDELEEQVEDERFERRMERIRWGHYD